jgi:carbonic anhydrase/acetyltransferase-like protein (isoleucine patch superfamily)
MAVIVRRCTTSSPNPAKPGVRARELQSGDSRVHVGHDCQIGDRVVLSQGAGLAGHVEVGDGAVVGGMAGVHQMVRIGAYAIIEPISS